MTRRLLQVASWVALAGMIAPALLFLAGRISLDQSKEGLLVATIAWFLVTPLWMGREPTESAAL
jgi:hypothetical protein